MLLAIALQAGPALLADIVVSPLAALVRDHQLGLQRRLALAQDSVERVPGPGVLLRPLLRLLKQGAVAEQEGMPAAGQRHRRAEDCLRPGDVRCLG